MGTGRPRFRPLRRLATIVVALLAAHVVVHLLTIDAIVDRRTLVRRASEGGGVTWDDLDATFARWVSAGRWGLLLLIVTAIVWCSWQYHGHVNLIRRHVVGVRHSPGWAVGWWFIPIANLWMPFRAMSELARASRDPERWTEAKRPWSLIPWWITWIASTTIVRVVSLQAPPTTEEAARRLDVAMVTASACSVAAAVLGAVVVASITRDQERMAATAPPLFDDAAPAIALPSRPDA